MSCRSLLLFGVALAVGAASTGLFVGCRRREPAPPAETVETAVRFTSIKGRVQVKRAGTLEWINATLAVTLRKADLVKTEQNATAQIRFADGTQFSVRPDSLIAILESSRDWASHEPQMALGIQSGEANFQTPAQDGKRKIETPGGRTTPERETQGNIKVQPDGKTGVGILKGKGKVETRAGQQLQLGPGEGVQIDAEGKAGPKLPLPEEPTLTAPPNQFKAYYPDPSQATTLLAWNSVAGAKSYRVVVDSSSTFADPFMDRHVSGGTQEELQGLGAGTYYWKVAAVGTDGAEGMFASPWCFSLLSAQPGVLMPPRLVLDAIEVRGNQLHVRGRTEPGVTVTINGERIPVQQDGSFNEHVVLTRRATVVSIRATGVTGAITEQQLPIIVPK